METEDRCRIQDNFRTEPRGPLPPDWQRAQRTTMSSMLSAVANHWVQPLNTLGLIVQSMEMGHEDGPHREDFIRIRVEKAMIQIRKMSGIINDFVSFYGSDEEKANFDAMAAVGTALKLASAGLGAENISFHINCQTHGRTFEDFSEPFCCTASTVFGQKNIFGQAVLNLICNAQEAIKVKRAGSGTGTGNRGLIAFDFYHTNSTLSIEISDNGCGIEPDALGLIFEPYFSTGDRGRFLGLGLHESESIVTNMGGSLTAANGPHGAVFTMNIPRIQQT